MLTAPCRIGASEVTPENIPTVVYEEFPALRSDSMMDGDELLGSSPWALASLRIASETLAADEIGDLLELRATSTRTSEGEPAFAVWMFESGLSPSAPVEDHLYILMEHLSDHGDAIRQLVEMATVEIWLSFSPGDRHRSAVIDSKVLADIGSLGIDVVFDAYPAGRGRKSS